VSHSFSIPQENLPRLEEQLAALNKRAARLHCSPITYSVAPERTVTVLRHAAHGFDPECRDMEWTDEAIPDHWYVLGERTYYRVTVEGEAPRYAGWTLAAVINVVSTEDTGGAYPLPSRRAWGERTGGILATGPGAVRPLPDAPHSE